MKRFLAAIIAFALLPVLQIHSACTITMQQLQVSPPTTGATACWDIPFNSSCDLPAGDFLQIVFPQGTQLDWVSTGAVYFEGRADRIDVSGLMVIIQLTAELKSGNHKVRICDVINPPRIGPHQVFITTKDGSFGSPPFLFKETGVSPATVVPKPDYVKECAEYTITFNVTSESGKGCHCSRETLFHLDFALEFEIPLSIDPRYITVNGVAADSVKVDGRRLIVRSRLTFQAGQQVVIKIDSRAGIRNPSKPGWYRVTVFTSADRIPTPSNPYYIRPSSVSRASVEIDNPFTCAQTTFLIKFSTGPYGEIAANGFIKIYFPQGFVVPKTVEPGNIAVNNARISQKISGNIDPYSTSSVLSIPVPSPIGTSSSVEVVILGGAGIRLPETIGNHSVDIETSSEPVRVPSMPFTVAHSAITNVSYQPEPAFVTLPARQAVTFRTGGCGNLVPGIDTITVQFPDSMWMPKSLLCKSITVNETPIASIPFVSGFQVTIPVPKPIDGGSRVTVVIPDECGIRNPAKAGAGYMVKVWTTREQSPSASNVTVFSSTRLSGVKAELSKNLVSSRVKARIQFVTGKAGSIRNNTKISIALPEGFEFRGAVAMMNFSIDGVTSRGAKWTKPVLELVSPKDCNPNSAVYVDFDEDAGLTTPPASGFYKISVATESEPDLEESEDIAINSRPELKIVSPNPNSRGWHTSEPVVMMLASSQLDGNPSISVILDNAKVDFKGSVRITDGYHVLEAWAEDAYGNKSEKQVISYSVDTISPMFDVEQGTFHTNSKSFFKMIRAKDENSVTVESEGDEGIVFTESLLNFTSINISSREERCYKGRLAAADEAGNTASFEFSVCFDWTAPILEVPARLESTDPVVAISGKTEYGCEVASRETFIVEPDGTFKAQVKLNHGANSISIQSRDRAGNITKKTVMILANLEVSLLFENGKRDVYVNGQKTTLKTAPFILKGFLYAPFDLLTKNCAFKLETWPYSESILRADGSRWTFSHPKKSIEMAEGNGMAVVDGELVKMPSAPVMKSGVLYVPLRFTAGLFGLAPVAVGKAVRISYFKN